MHRSRDIHKLHIGWPLSASRREGETDGRAVKGSIYTAAIHCALTTPTISLMEGSSLSREIQNPELVFRQLWIKQQRGNLSLWILPLLKCLLLLVQ
jgi:hypothetical protein